MIPTQQGLTRTQACDMIENIRAKANKIFDRFVQSATNATNDNIVYVCAAQTYDEPLMDAIMKEIIEHLTPQQREVVMKTTQELL